MMELDGTGEEDISSFGNTQMVWVCTGESLTIRQITPDLSFENVFKLHINVNIM